MFVVGVILRRRLVGVTVRNVFEVIVDALAKLAQETIGDEWRKYFPIAGTIFFFSALWRGLTLTRWLDVVPDGAAAQET